VLHLEGNVEGKQIMGLFLWPQNGLSPHLALTFLCSGLSFSIIVFLLLATFDGEENIWTEEG
jgi:hypothetical protein